MNRKVVDVYYNVQNMDRSIAFYTQLLGLEKRDTNPYWTSLDAGGVRIGLHWTEGAPVPAIPRDGHGAHAGATLTLSSSDIDADRKRLEAAGVQILGEIKQDWGQLRIFEDPDGNVLKFMKA